MRKIVRIIIRIVLTILLIVVDMFFIGKLFESNILPELQVGIFLFLISISILIGICLISNPGTRMNLFRRRKVKLKRKKELPEFKMICEYLMNEYGKVLEKYRKHAMKYVGLLVLFFVLILIFTIVLAKFFELRMKILILVYVIPIIILVYLFEKNKRIFYDEYKRNIIKNLVNVVDDKLNYDYDGSEQIYNLYAKANFDETEFNTFESTDYIYGQIKNDIDIQMSKITLLNCNNSGEIINVADTFVFGYNKIKFSSPCEIKIVKNKFLYKNKVEMDSEEFEKYFDVISDSQMIAMQVLTHDVMEEIVHFYRDYGIDFKINIKENSIYIKFETGDVFKPKLLKKVIDNDLLWVYYCILNFTISFSYEINKVLEGLEM